MICYQDAESGDAIELPRDIFPAPMSLELKLAMLAGGLLFLAWLFHRYRQRHLRLSHPSCSDPSSQSQVDEAIELTPSPVETAQLRLTALKDLPLRSEWEWQVFHHQASFILRDFIKEQFQVPAHERTTEEVVVLCPHETEEHLSQLLCMCDAVKFAQRKAETKLAHSWVDRCADFLGAVS
jgi:hypothetical protein